MLEYRRYGNNNINCNKFVVLFCKCTSNEYIYIYGIHQGDTQDLLRGKSAESTIINLFSCLVSINHYTLVLICPNLSHMSESIKLNNVCVPNNHLCGSLYDHTVYHINVVNAFRSLSAGKRDGVDHISSEAPNDPAYKRWSCHSSYKLLCKLCRNLLSPAMGARYTICWTSRPLDGWRCSS